MEKVAIVNRTNLKNYGSVLQVYALCEAVKNLGYESEVVWEQGSVSKNYDFRFQKMFMTAMKMIAHPSLIVGVVNTMKEVKAKPVSERKAEKFDTFVSKHITQKLYSSKMLFKIAKEDEYAKFICGSDQVWCSTTMYVDPLMYLRFVPEHKRIAYAPSIGRDYIPKYNRSQMKKYISGIPYVSIREDDGQQLLKELTGREVPVVLDPTLLLEQNQWKQIACSGIRTQEKYALLYFLDETTEKNQKEIADFLEQQHLYAYSIGQELKVVGKSGNVQSLDCGPNDFLSLVQNAEIVITDSYHGMLFSVIFHKIFWSIERTYQQYDQSSRQKTILSRLGLEKRYIKCCKDISLEPIDYNAIRKSLNQLRKESISYLKTAIEG